MESHFTIDYTNSLNLEHLPIATQTNDFLDRQLPLKWAPE
jgi:hypothetical protein